MAEEVILQVVSVFRSAIDAGRKQQTTLDKGIQSIEATIEREELDGRHSDGMRFGLGVGISLGQVENTLKTISTNLDHLLFPISTLLGIEKSMTSIMEEGLGSRDKGVIEHIESLREVIGEQHKLLEEATAKIFASGIDEAKLRSCYPEEVVQSLLDEWDPEQILGKQDD